MSPKKQDERGLIGTDLDSTLVVEAAAGTGKTTQLVRRVVRLIQTGRAASIEQIVAVTFSEKAAGELKLRLREELEQARTAVDPMSEDSARLDAAVQRFEEAHVSTIHGFCADLLRERPVEARVDPSFEVLTEGQAEHLFDEAFADWIQAQLDKPSDGVRRSLRRPRAAWIADAEEDGPIERLRRAGMELLQWRDHPAPWKQPPGFAREREIALLLDQLAAFAELSANPVNPRGDFLYLKTDDLRHAHGEIHQLRSRGHEDFDGWEARLCSLAAQARNLRDAKGSGAQYSKTVVRQRVIDARDALVDGLVEFRSRADADLVARLHAEMQRCIEGFEERKAKAGALDFLDLLIRARNLVRDVAFVRREFQARFRFVLVDEFQDTDPLQADLLWMLAAAEPDRFEGDPLSLPIRPGALFIVGDPKQSVYRFRRADVGIYQAICQRLIDAGAKRVLLQKSFRSVPGIQRAVNAAFSAHIRRDDRALQADYVELQPDRPDLPGQPSVVALPVSRPYGKRQVTLDKLAEWLPPAIAEFVRWLVADSGWVVSGSDQTLRPVRAGDVCLLFRNFIGFKSGKQTDITQPYVEALESRGISHLLVGGKAFHEREEVDALRTALAAVERPDDALSVFATLRGPFFAVGEEELLAYHALGQGFRPYDVATDLPDALRPVSDALGVLRELNRMRNHRPVAETIGRLIEATRAHAGFVLWRGGEQVLANVLQIAELARQYEAEGGMSFRGFVADLARAAMRAPTPEAPILEEGTDGVRLMTVHKAKGLEFPVVILADIGCKLSRDEAQRHLDTRRGLCAIKLAGWTPMDLAENNDLEADRDRAEGVRLAYVAATRARDLLVVPAIGDQPFDRGWVSPLSEAIYPPVPLRQTPSRHAGVPEFKGKDTVLERPDMEAATTATVRPGAYPMKDPVTGESYSVVWWDPLAIDGKGDERRGIRREYLITKEAKPEDVAADRQRFEAWRTWKDAVLTSGARPSVSLLTASEWARQMTQTPDIDRQAVEIHETVDPGPRPSGRRFGTLVHALLAAVPLEASASEIRDLALVHARVLAAPEAERAEAAVTVDRVLRHRILGEARDAVTAGRACRREAPVSIVLDGVLIDGQLDLAYETPDGWVVVDFKTDVELGGNGEIYRRQVSLYVTAIARATGKHARGVLLKI